MKYKYAVVGGGSAGCVMASRLSEVPTNQVLLIEAGQDIPPNAVPDDIAAAYAGRAAMNRNYVWDGLTAQLAENRARQATIARYEQARVMGGGSSINGQVATRGAPEDYDRWQALGATGWNWESILPYFRKLETDLDFEGPAHGDRGPIRIRRTPRDEWDGFTRSIVAALEEQGFQLNPDINDGFRAGYSPTPLNTYNGRRVSSAVGYLDARVRARPNLTIAAHTQAIRIVFDGTRVKGVEVEDRHGRRLVEADEVILSAGAIWSPTLLMRSGVGPAAHLAQLGIPVVADLPGVGRNLQEHAAIHVSAYLLPEARAATAESRHNSIYLRYASGLGETFAPDMLLNFACRSGWHAVGRRLGTIQAYILQPFSRGSVRLASADPNAIPIVDLNLLGDRRDLERLKDAFRRSVALFRSAAVARIARDPFATSYSDRVRRTGRVTLWNKLTTNLLAALLDASPAIRRLALEHLVNDAPQIDRLLADEALLEEHIARTVSGVWHPAGTCRMGDVSDPAAVTDFVGRVRGVQGLRIADNSVMPEVPRANTNLPAMMIGERMSALIRETAGAH